MKSPEKSDSNPAIIIYCKEWCSFISNLVNLLQENKRSFTFINLEYDAKAAQKLMSTIGRPLMLPIMEINGRYYQKPDFSEFNEFLRLHTGDPNKYDE